MFRNRALVLAGLQTGKREDLSGARYHCDTKVLDLHEIGGIKIIRYDGPVYFANADSFQKAVYHLSGLNPVEANRKIASALRAREKETKKNAAKHSADEDADRPLDLVEAGEPVSFTGSRFQSVEQYEAYLRKSAKNGLNVIILDASGWSFTDTVGLRGIKELIKKYASLQLTIFIAGLRPQLRTHFLESGVFSLLPEDSFFVTVHDAVLVAREEIGAGDGVEDDAVEELDSLSRKRSRRRKLTLDQLQGLEHLDPDASNDLSVLGEEIPGRV